MFDEPKKNARPPRTEAVSFWLDAHELWALQRAAQQTGRSISQFIRYALAQAIHPATSEQDKVHGGSNG
jgi:hypothetical protein